MFKLNLKIYIYILQSGYSKFRDKIYYSLLFWEKCRIGYSLINLLKINNKNSQKNIKIILIVYILSDKKTKNTKMMKEFVIT